jgi:hypothetical protein
MKGIPMPRGVPNVKTHKRMYVATMSFASDIGDATAGLTRVREGHEMLKRYPDWFMPIDEQPALGDVEAATAAPGETRGDDE